MTVRPRICDLWLEMSKKDTLGFHPKKAITQTAKEYGSQATVHGINYVSDSSSPLLDRSLWLAVVVIFSMAGIILSLQSYNDWQDDPVITTVATTGNINIEMPKLFSFQKSIQCHRNSKTNYEHRINVQVFA